MPYRLKFSTEADEQLRALENGGPATETKLNKVRPALALLEHDPRYPGLRSHQYENFPGAPTAKVWDSYVENKNPSAWRIYWMYGPNKVVGGTEIAIITVLSIGPRL